MASVQVGRDKRPIEDPALEGTRFSWGGETGARMLLQIYASLAQLAEQRTVNPRVVGSIPARSAKTCCECTSSKRSSYPWKRGFGKDAPAPCKWGCLICWHSSDDRAADLYSAGRGFESFCQLQGAGNLRYLYSAVRYCGETALQ